MGPENAMLVYILRHAKAHRDSPTGRDEDRPLNHTGLEQARFLADALARAEVRPNVVLTSPAERAARTARIIAAALDLEPVEEPDLAPDCSYNDIARVVRTVARGEAPAMIVGHNPILEDLVLGLTSGQPDAPHRLRTGELVILDMQPAGPGLQARLVERLRFRDSDD